MNYKLNVQVLVAALIAILIAVCSTNTILKKNEFTISISLLFPQGWSFFTKSPRDELINVYKIDRNNNLEIKTFSNLSKKSSYGFSRKSRRVAFEASLLSTVPGEWKDTTISAVKTMELQQLHNAVSINSVSYDTLKFNPNLRNLGAGDYLCVRYRTIPYVYFISDKASYSSDRRCCMKI